MDSHSCPAVARANGKVILLGEHAVVYGSPAIAAGIACGASARAVRAEVSRIGVGTYLADAGDGSDLGQALAALLLALSAPPVEVQATLEIPVGVGLGSSAALGVSVARAVLALEEFPGDPEDTARVLRATAAWESVFHGAPSGVDAAASAYGGCIWFSKEDRVRQLRLGRSLPLAIAIAGPAASTRLMVEGVAELKRRRPEVVQKALEGVRSLVGNARFCIEMGDLPGLGRLMDLNQMILAGLFVSNDAIENACRLARDAGALGAKLTGAGGGGAVLALADRDPEPVIKAWQGAGLSCFPTWVESATAGGVP